MNIFRSGAETLNHPTTGEAFAEIVERASGYIEVLPLNGYTPFEVRVLWDRMGRHLRRKAA